MSKSYFSQKTAKKKKKKMAKMAKNLLFFNPKKCLLFFNPKKFNLFFNPKKFCFFFNPKNKFRKKSILKKNWQKMAKNGNFFKSKNTPPPHPLSLPH